MKLHLVNVVNLFSNNNRLHIHDILILVILLARNWFSFIIENAEKVNPR